MCSFLLVLFHKNNDEITKPWRIISDKFTFIFIAGIIINCNVNVRLENMILITSVAVNSSITVITTDFLLKKKGETDVMSYIHRRMKEKKNQKKDENI